MNVATAVFQAPGRFHSTKIRSLKMGLRFPHRKNSPSRSTGLPSHRQPGSSPGFSPSFFLFLRSQDVSPLISRNFHNPISWGPRVPLGPAGKFTRVFRFAARNGRLICHDGLPVSWVSGFPVSNPNVFLATPFPPRGLTFTNASTKSFPQVRRARAKGGNSVLYQVPNQFFGGVQRLIIECVIHGVDIISQCHQ